MASEHASDLRFKYFDTLRDEIRATKARIFILLVLAAIGTPLLAYFVFVLDSQLLVMVSPIVVMLVLILYLSEQIILMRAGRYIRDHVEAEDSDWEHWIGRSGLRSAERQLFGLFVVLGLFFFAALLVFAVDYVLSMQPAVRNYQYFFWRYGIFVSYAVATVWGLLTILRFWRDAVTNSMK